ncbi:hypothetical protein DNHGIG_31220 [Collibacillus ludicampi]|uniref:Uncharacterized protein n=1 Tax=Collibacillus ludicampi TaxID=2771369 RepID=A0AAV4LIH6_9BACL|nr:hypothetical protein [Collibacillus ludicampi]GIM47573.1 hypothetical protein DNHGIG_31220 [Collibacillus ludicampi]
MEILSSFTQLTARLLSNTLLNLDGVPQPVGTPIHRSAKKEGDLTPLEKQVSLRENPSLPVSGTLTKILTDLQIDDTREARQVIKEMVTVGLPVTKEEVMKVLQVIKEIKGDERAVTTAVRMLALQIPLSKHTLLAVDALWNGHPLHELLEQVRPFQQLLDEHHTMNARGNTLPPTIFEREAERAHSFFEESETFLSFEKWMNLSQKEKADILSRMRERLGLSHERELVRHWVEKSGRSERHMRYRTWKEFAIHLLYITGKEGEASCTTDEKLQQAIDHLLANLTGQQLMHTHKDETSPFFYHFFSLPFSYENKKSTIGIHILAHKDEKRKLDPANFLLCLHLELPRTGTVDVFLHSIQKVINLRLLVPESSLLPVFDDEISTLREGIRAVGYHLGAVRVEKRTAPLTDADITLMMRYLSAKQVDLRI